MTSNTVRLNAIVFLPSAVTSEEDLRPNRTPGQNRAADWLVCGL
jgi:hypothetical protein